MTTPADILAEARSWLGTPFHHQGRCKGVGVDCLGLVVGVGRALRLSDADGAGYPRQPDGRALLAGLDRHYVRLVLGRQRPGDILVFRIHSTPQHLALLTASSGMIHVHAAVGRVVETGLDAGWAARLVAASFPPLLRPVVALEFVTPLDAAGDDPLDRPATVIGRLARRIDLLARWMGGVIDADWPALAEHRRGLRRVPPVPPHPGAPLRPLLLLGHSGRAATAGLGRYRLG